MKGVLAGRLKRRWLATGRREDGERAEALYMEGLREAEASCQTAQVFYHAINVAFLRLARQGDRTSAASYARKALAACGESEVPADHWNLATQGEACLILGEYEQALVRYRQALDMDPPPRAIDSMYAQAVRVADLVSEDRVVRQMEAIFRPRVVTDPAIDALEEPPLS